MTMIKTAHSEGSRFVAVYGVNDGNQRLSQGLTPSRDSVREVVADLEEMQTRAQRIYYAQIIDLVALEQVEPSLATIVRLRKRAFGKSGSRHMTGAMT